MAKAKVECCELPPLKSRRLMSPIQAGGLAAVFKVLANDTRGIPQSMLFRTGGSNSVRGYDLESLGDDASGAVLGGRYFALASVEFTHWFRERIGGAVFVDAGNAWNDASRFPLVLGYGVGLRVASPIGPLRIDVAYGQADASVRLHFSLGLTF